jgi:glucokinase
MAIECGNCAMATLPEGGIYLVGNVINKISEWIINDPEKTFDVSL